MAKPEHLRNRSEHQLYRTVPAQNIAKTVVTALELFTRYLISWGRTVNRFASLWVGTPPNVDVLGLGLRISSLSMGVSHLLADRLHFA